MKEMVVISGKGGTGKTSLTAAFAHLAKPCVLADCDVDAANLALIAQPEIQRRHPFFSGHEAVIHSEQCAACGICMEVCRFDAVRKDVSESAYTIDKTRCEGCGVCVHFCPEKAITFPDRFCGEWFESASRLGPMVHARLEPGGENSGKLVTRVRTEARRKAAAVGAEWIIIDGPPGIGCPVIASVTDADAVIAVTEPSLAGMHDLNRLLDLARHFDVPAWLVVNRWDMNPELTRKTEQMAVERGVGILGRIPYDRSVIEAQLEAKSILELPPSPAGEAFSNAWKKLETKIQPMGDGRPLTIKESITERCNYESCSTGSE